MTGPRTYTDKTLKRLFGLSRNKCSFPDCEREMSDENSAKHSNICHIEAAHKGGERYREAMSDKERADYENLILLCPPHHDETNDVNKYTVEVLKKMKKAHELEMAKRVSVDVQKRPSLLTEIIKRIAEVEIDDYENLEVENSFSLEEKIKYNKVITHEPILKEYRIYQGKINKLYTEFEKSGNGRKNTLLRKVRNLYLETKGEVLKTDQSHENLQKNADRLIASTQRKMHELIDQHSDMKLPYEEVEFAISIIMVDAFMRCKILEEPK